MAQLVQKEDALDLIQLFKSRLDQSGGGGLLPRVIVYSQSGNTVTMSKDDITLTATESNGTWTFNLPEYGVWTITASKNDTAKTFTVIINTIKIYDIDAFLPVRYGYRIRKDELDPYERVEYLYDAVGMSPAHMVYDTDSDTAGTSADKSYFDYGDWQNVWFIKNNKPCMLKTNGSVDYYLNPNDYSLKEDFTPSDASNIYYDGNAMAQFPLCWIYRYEDDDYLYEIVSNVQWDENYKAYAHTDYNGVIKDNFYLGLLPVCGNSSSLRCILDQPLLRTTVSTNHITVAAAYSVIKSYGSNWDLKSWSQSQLLRTLATLISKSCNIGASFGYCKNISDKLSPIFKTSGQFYGYQDAQHLNKVFHTSYHCFEFVAGALQIQGNIYLKMTPEGNGYSSDYNTSGHYLIPNYKLPYATGDAGGSKYFPTSMSCTEYGLLPLAFESHTGTYGEDPGTYWGDTQWACSNYDTEQYSKIFNLGVNFTSYCSWNDFYNYGESSRLAYI